MLHVYNCLNNSHFSCVYPSTHVLSVYTAVIPGNGSYFAVLLLCSFLFTTTVFPIMFILQKLDQCSCHIIQYLAVFYMYVPHCYVVAQATKYWPQLYNYKLPLCHSHMYTYKISMLQQLSYYPLLFGSMYYSMLMHQPI